MKKMFGLMVLAGVILAASTAGACDAGVMGADRILLQSLISAALIYFGTRFKEWGDEPNMVLIGKFSAIMHQNAHRYTKYRFRFWHTLTKNLHVKNSATLFAGKIDGFLVRKLPIGCRLSKLTSRKHAILTRKGHIGFVSPHLMGRSARS